MSPGIKGATPLVKTASAGIKNDKIYVPQVKVITLPSEAASQVFTNDLVQPRSESQPITKEAASIPNKYPNVGPKLRPDLPKAKTGKPKAPNDRYPITHANPRDRPHSNAIKATPNVWPVIGTGVNDNGIEICASKHSKIMPAVTAVTFCKIVFPFFKIKSGTNAVVCVIGTPSN